MDYFNSSKEERKNLLTLDYQTRLKATEECIKQVLTKTKKPIIQFSGGVDSCVMADIIHKIDSTIPCLFNDWGIFLPEQEQFCIKFFKKYNYKYYISRNGIEWRDFIREGFPIFKGVKFVDKKNYKEFKITEKCRNLKDKCWNKFYKEYKPDYYFVGMVHDESPQRKNLFLQYGFIIPKDKGILVKPIILLKKQEMFDYSKENNLLYPKDYYKDEYQGKTFEYKHCDLGCFMCGIRFNEFGYGRLGRLARNNPELFNKLLDLGLRETLNKIILNYSQANFIGRFLDEYDKKRIILLKKTAYDLDGVICAMPKRDKAFNKQNKYERNKYNELKIEHFLNTKVIRRPLENSWILISGRREKYRKETETWLNKNKLTPNKILLMIGSLTFENILEHKISKLKEYKIERYYEDDPKLVREIKKALPDLEVILVPRNEDSVKIIKVPFYKQEKLF